MMLFFADAFFIPCAILIAFYIRLGSIDEVLLWSELSYLFMTQCFSLLLFYYSGFYQNIVRYLGYDGLVENIKLITISTLVFTLCALMTQNQIPRSVPFLYWLFALLFIGGSRFVIWRYYVEKNKKFSEKIAIYGAGDAGRKLLLALKSNHHLNPVFFIDDDKYHGTKISGLKVYAPENLTKLLEKHPVSEILLAMPSVSMRRIRNIIDGLENLPVVVRKVPDIADIISGRERIDALKPLALEDLLGRTSVGPDERLFSKCINNKVVMVTGAGGSIGSELCRQIVKHKPKQIILFEQSEYALYQIEQELQQALNHSIHIVALLGSVQNKSFTQKILQIYQVQTLYHAAAYKHVPIVEENIVEGIKNNIFGTCHLAQSAIKAKVEHFVFISTDKAVRPTNIMGATKRFAEIVLQALADDTNNKTIISMVRFGNVLGSSGSVVPLFEKQIQQGGPVTVTDPNVTRYFMTIAEASQLVLQAGTMSKGGDVFVLDMGKPIKIDDLARKMIHLAGKQVLDENNAQKEDESIEIVYTGLRAGEKLHEELLLIEDNVVKTEHPDILRANEAFITFNLLEKTLEQLSIACEQFDVLQLKEILMQSQLNYNPNNHELVDLLWCKTA